MSTNDDRAEWLYTRKQLDNLMKGVFEGGIDPASLPVGLYNAILATLSDGVVRGFGFGDLTDEAQDLLAHFDHNVAVFSAAKTHQQIADMTRKLFDPETGLKRSFSAFKADATEIFDQYNVNWLKTEYRTAFNNAFGARQWLEFSAKKSALPVIRYETANDERVRDEHVDLDGIVRHIDDPFWRRWFPPNGWNCRCDATQHEIGDLTFTSDDVIAKIKPPSELFDFNPAIDKVIFDPNHPYMSRVAERYHVIRDRNFGLPVPPKPQPKPPKPILPEIKPEGSEFEPRNLAVATGVKMPAEMWQLLKREVELVEGNKSFCTNLGKRVSIDTKSGRYGKGSDEIKKVIAHEFGHATHDHHGIFSWQNVSTPWDEFEEPYKRARKLAGVGASRESAKLIAKKHTFFSGFDSNARAMRESIAKKYGYTVGSKVEKEMFLGAADTIGALTHEKYGFGHGKSYYQGNGGYMSRAEFFAHCWENKFNTDNIYLREVYPEIAKEMDAMTEGVIKRIKSKQ